MRTIERTSTFRRDFKRQKAGRHKHEIDVLLSTVVSLLAKDDALPGKTRDHGLGGEWRDHRECHLKRDLLLIYRKPSPESVAACPTQFPQRSL